MINITGKDTTYLYMMQIINAFSDFLFLNTLDKKVIV
jgi:hypothetical protein